MTDLYLLVANSKTLSIKRIRVLLKLQRDNSSFFFYFRRILLLRTDSYYPIPSSLEKEKGKFVVVFLRPPSNVNKLGNFTCSPRPVTAEKCTK